MLLGLDPYTNDNNNRIDNVAHTAAFGRQQTVQDPVMLAPSGQAGTRKAKVSTGTLGSPFNELNPAASNGNRPVANAGLSTNEKDRERKKTSKEATLQPQQQGQSRSLGQSRRALPPSQLDTSTSTAQTMAPPNTKAAAAASTRKAPPVSGNNTSATVTGNGGGASAGMGNGSRSRKDSASSEQSVKKDDLLERLAGAVK